MKRIALTIAACLAAGSAFAQSSATTSSASDAGAMAQTGAITFEGSHQASRVATTPPAYIPPAMFGGANNCGQSNTAGVSVTGFGIGTALASESDACNAREDTAIAYKLGYQDVAALRFFCFGESANRMAYEAAGRTCPAGATAQGLPTQTAVAGYQGNDPIVIRRLTGR